MSVTGSREAAGSSHFQPGELHSAFRLKWFVERMPGLGKKDGRRRRGGGEGELTSAWPR